MFEAFWKRLQEAVIATTPKARSGLDDFTLRRSPRVDTQSAALRVLDTAAAAQAQQLAFTVEHEQLVDRYDLYVGLQWAQSVPASDGLYQQPALKKLKQRLLADGWIDWAPWWVCGHYVHQFPSPENFLCAWVDDPDGVIEPLTAAFWQMVQKTEPDIIAVNKSLALR